MNIERGDVHICGNILIRLDDGGRSQDRSGDSRPIGAYQFQANILHQIIIHASSGARNVTAIYPMILSFSQRVKGRLSNTALLVSAAMIARDPSESLHELNDVPSHQPSRDTALRCHPNLGPLPLSAKESKKPRFD